MFERYTEKARRVIFFARYEASQYGSPYIDSEHLLLGLFREDRQLLNQALARRNAEDEIRKAIESGIQPRERISTSVEVPLSEDAKRILRFAADEAEQLGRRYVGSEHIALGILMTPDSVASRILVERGASLAGFRAQVSSSTDFGREAWRLRQGDEAAATIKAFLAGIGANKWTEISSYFTAYSQFVDSAGKRWIGQEEIGQQFVSLFVPYAKKGVTFILETIEPGGTDLFWASVLWENVSVAGESLKSLHRMTILVEQKGRDWQVVLIQVTPVRV